MTLDRSTSPKNQALNCFISYCHDDADVDAIEAFEKLLLEVAGSTMRIFRDKKNVRIGEAISEYEDLILHVDAVIIILTPQLKIKIDSRLGGVYREYSRAHGRFLQSRRLQQDTTVLDPYADRSLDPFIIIPVLFSGDHQKSVPSDLADILYSDFRQFRTMHTRDGASTIPDETRRRHLPEFRKILDSIKTIGIERTQEFARRYRENLKHLLLDTKAQDIKNNLTQRQLNELFVKTKAFNGISSQKNLILVGRKGSGKSTITEYIHRRATKEYKPKIHVDVDKFLLEYIFNIVFDPRLSSELANVLPRGDFFKATWRSFFLLSCIQVLLREFERGRLTAFQNESCKGLAEFFAGTVPEEYRPTAIEDSQPWPMYVWCMNRIVSGLDAAIEKSRASASDFYADLALRTTEDALLAFVFPRKVMKALQSVINLCQRKFLFALDGFDSNFDRFRVRTLSGHFVEEHRSFRTRMEIDWLRSLLLAAIEIKAGDSQAILSKSLDFCITVPKDRFMEIRSEERDDYVFRWKHADIMWTAVELSILCRKRLELLSGVVTDKTLEALDRLDQVILEGFPGIPTRLTFQFHGAHVSIDTFAYLLRHTFWRPRDILFYLARIVTTQDSLRGTRKSLSVEMMQHIVSGTTFDVVRSEFLNEFKSICTNIEWVIRCFERASIVMDFDDVAERVGRLDYNYAHETESAHDIWAKIEFLFEVGFLGVRLPAEDGRGGGTLSADLFIFSHGERAFSSMGKNDRKAAKYVIHPVFVEFLRLNTANEPFILNYSREFIRHNDQLPPWA